MDGKYWPRAKVRQARRDRFDCGLALTAGHEAFAPRTRVRNCARDPLQRRWIMSIAPSKNQRLTCSSMKGRGRRSLHGEGRESDSPRVGAKKGVGRLRDARGTGAQCDAALAEGGSRAPLPASRAATCSRIWAINLRVVDLGNHRYMCTAPRALFPLADNRTNVGWNWKAVRDQSLAA